MKSLLAACLCLLAIQLPADEATDRTAIVRRAREMVEATFKSDPLAVLRFTHPSIVRISGGEEPIKVAINRTVSQMSERRIKFISMEAQASGKFFAVGDKTYTLVKTRTVLQIPGQIRMTEAGALLAVRETLDGDWTFVRVSAQLAGNRPLLQNLLPGIPDELVIEAPGQILTEPLKK